MGKSHPLDLLEYLTKFSVQNLKQNNKDIENLDNTTHTFELVTHIHRTAPISGSSYSN